MSIFLMAKWSLNINQDVIFVVLTPILPIGITVHKFSYDCQQKVKQCKNDLNVYYISTFFLS